jgi:hypothetical protein
MEIDRDLERMIEADPKNWQSREHKAVFCVEGGDDSMTVGSLFVDGRPIRPDLLVDCHWVTIAEARHVAERLGVSLRMS